MASVPYTPVSAQCNAGLCLNQVAGHQDNNPQAYLASCRSAFGFPAVPTVTVPSDPIFSTEVSTSTYIDIVISTSFESSTVSETSTVYEYVSETATEYSTTILNTLTSTAPAVASILAPLKKRGPSKKRLRCKSRTHSTTTSSAPASSTAVPKPEACADLAEFSSACACLEPSPVTVYSPPSTTVVTSTVPSTIQSAIETIITIAVTSVIISQIQTTTTSTLTTETATTTTTTTTDIPAPTALATGGLVVTGGTASGYAVTLASTQPALYLSLTSGATPVSFVLGQPSLALASDTSYAMFIRMSTTGYGVVFITTQSYTSGSAYTWAKATCSVEPGTQKVTCGTSTYSLSRFLKCGSVVYMANAATTPGGCEEIHFKAVSV